MKKVVATEEVFAELVRSFSLQLYGKGELISLPPAFEEALVAEDRDLVAGVFRDILSKDRDAVSMETLLFGLEFPLFSDFVKILLERVISLDLHWRTTSSYPIVCKELPEWFDVHLPTIAVMSSLDTNGMALLRESQTARDEHGVMVLGVPTGVRDPAQLKYVHLWDSQRSRSIFVTLNQPLQSSLIYPYLGGVHGFRAHRLGITTLESHVLEIGMDKDELYGLFVQEGIPTPRQVRVIPSSDEKIDRASVPYSQFWIKPAWGSGGHDVFFWTDLLADHRFSTQADWVASEHIPSAIDDRLSYAVRVLTTRAAGQSPITEIEDAVYRVRDVPLEAANFGQGARRMSHADFWRSVGRGEDWIAARGQELLEISYRVHEALEKTTGREIPLVGCDAIYDEIEGKWKILEAGAVGVGGLSSNSPAVRRLIGILAGHARNTKVQRTEKTYSVSGSPEFFEYLVQRDREDWGPQTPLSLLAMAQRELAHVGGLYRFLFILRKIASSNYRILPRLAKLLQVTFERLRQLPREQRDYYQCRILLFQLGLMHGYPDLCLAVRSKNDRESSTLYLEPNEAAPLLATYIKAGYLEEAMTLLTACERLSAYGSPEFVRDHLDHLYMLLMLLNTRTPEIELMANQLTWLKYHHHNILRSTLLYLRHHWSEADRWGIFLELKETWSSAEFYALGNVLWGHEHESPQPSHFRAWHVLQVANSPWLVYREPKGAG